MSRALGLCEAPWMRSSSSRISSSGVTRRWRRVRRVFWSGGTAGSHSRSASRQRIRARPRPPKNLLAPPSPARALAADPAHHGIDVGLRGGGGGVDPVQHVEAGAGHERVEGDDLVAERLLAVVPQHRSHLAGGVEHDDGAGPGEQGGDAGARGLEAARAGEHQGVGGGRLARVDQQRRLAASPPAGLVGGIERDAFGGAVLVDAVGLADHQAAIGRVRTGEALAGLVHGEPVGMAEIVGAAAAQAGGAVAAERVGPGGDAVADERTHHADGDGDLVGQGEGVEQRDGRVAGIADIGPQPPELGPAGQDRAAANRLRRPGRGCGCRGRCGGTRSGLP